MRNSSIVIERSYSAPLDELWQLWTTQRGLESWWGPEGYECKVLSIESRAGGIVHYDLRAHAPEQIEALHRMGRPTSHEEWTRFTEHRPNERVSLTTLIDFLPGVRPYEHTVTVDFSSLRERARMVVTLEPMHSDEFTALIASEFTSQLTKLDGRFATR